jgi:parvulin-like peptidyl-prolyl isomerase
MKRATFLERNQTRTRERILVGTLAGFLALMANPSFAMEIVRVNQKVLTADDLKASLGSMNEGQKRGILSDVQGRQEVVSNLIEVELMVQEAGKQKLDQDAEYRAALEQFRRQYLSTRLAAKQLEPKLTPAALKTFYNLHRSQYTTDRAVVQHILVSDEGQALEMLKRARAEGADFQALAEKFSKDPSAKNNRGEIGLVTRDGPFVAEFKDAVFNASQGEIVGPVRTTYGFHVIKVVEKKLGRTLNFDEVEVRVKEDYRRVMIGNYISELRKQAKISINDQNLKKL